MDSTGLQDDFRDLQKIRELAQSLGGVGGILAVLNSPAAETVRRQVAELIVSRLVPVNFLVPDTYKDWAPPIRDAMRFVVLHLPAARLAPKIMEQLELPENTPPERRLLRLIAKVPGLQKLGQVVARNRHLRPRLRRALIELENGIRDTSLEEVQATIRAELGHLIKTHGVVVSNRILSEASVSTVVRFTWRNPRTQQRERGVFKVLKPHVPDCFAQDMQILNDLARLFGTRQKEYGRVARILPDTFAKVRRLLQHEVDFRGEQNTLRRAAEIYRSKTKIRIPRLMPDLCTDTITAMTEEPGGKIVNAARHLPARARGRIAEQLVEALVAVPLLSRQERAMFHADPHAGNLLYDVRSGELTVLDWALKEELTREQRRRLALLTIAVALRDPVGIWEQVVGLAERPRTFASVRGQRIRQMIGEFVDDLPLTRLPGVIDAMRLLEACALDSVRFPAPLIMFSKMLFTLEDVIDDIGEKRRSMSFIIGRYLLSGKLARNPAVALPIKMKDWLALPQTAMLTVGRLGVRVEQAAIDRVL